MGLIKSANAPPALQPFSMRDIENQARALLLRARQKADQLLAEAQQAAQELQKQAHAEGLAAGRKEGLAKGRDEGLKAGKDAALGENRAKLTSLVTTLTQTLSALDKSRRELAATATRDVIGLAIAIAERVTKRHGALDPAVAVANVTEAIKLVIHAADIRIAVNPAQKATLQDALPALKMQWPTLAHVEVIEDPSLAPGGCRIFTAAGQIDGDLDEQLRRVAADLVPSRDADGQSAISPIANRKSQTANPE